MLLQNPVYLTLGSCMLQPGQDFEVVPGTEFTVSRTAQRNNKSDYFINDRRSNFTEVTEMLKGKGIDLDNNRFLILQAWPFSASMAGSI